MLKSHSNGFNKIHMLIDAVLLVAMFILAYFLRFNVLTVFPIFAIEPSTIYSSFPDFCSQYSRYLLAIIPGYIIIYYVCGLYKPKRSRRTIREVWDLIKANLFGLLFIFAVLYFFKQIHVSRKMIAVFAVCNTSFGFLYRYMIKRVLYHIRKGGHNLKHLLIVGYSRTCEGYIERIRQNPSFGYKIHGILDDNLVKGTKFRDAEVIGTTELLPELLKIHSFDEVIITLRIEDYDKLSDIVEICERFGVHTKFVPDYMNVIPTVPDFEDFEGLPVVSIRRLPLSDVFNQFIKRMSDIILSIIFIIIGFIPMFIIGVLVKCTSAGPVFYKQERVGLHNKTFRMIKFRSMRVQAVESEKEGWTTADDPRVTKFGRFIRRTSLDELPQLFNVLKGEMSLIGPRPERPQYVAHFSEEIPRYMVKHQVRPGITGWAQVNGFRGDTSIRKRIEYDLYYIEHWSVGFDIKILVRTLFCGFINKDAY